MASIWICNYLVLIMQISQSNHFRPILLSEKCKYKMTSELPGSPEIASQWPQAEVAVNDTFKQFTCRSGLLIIKTYT